MARIMAIDYGLKRTGIAVTDPLQIIATGLTTIPSKELIDFIKNYLKSETLERIIIISRCWGQKVSSKLISIISIYKYKRNDIISRSNLHIYFYFSSILYYGNFTVQIKLRLSLLRVIFFTIPIPRIQII